MIALSRKSGSLKGDTLSCGRTTPHGRHSREIISQLFPLFGIYIPEPVNDIIVQSALFSRPGASSFKELLRKPPVMGGFLFVFHSRFFERLTFNC